MQAKKKARIDINLTPESELRSVDGRLLKITNSTHVRYRTCFNRSGGEITSDVATLVD